MFTLKKKKKEEEGGFSTNLKIQSDSSFSYFPHPSKRDHLVFSLEIRGEAGFNSFNPGTPGALCLISPSNSTP
jgi:hypothetical protein